MANRDRTLPLTSNERKVYSVADGCEAYFPAALAGVARNSFIGGAKHTNGELVHKRWLSKDHGNCISRHKMDIRDLMAARERGTKTVMMYVFNLTTKVDELIEVTIEAAILMEADCLSWRSLALAQELHEQLGGAPLAPAALLEPPTPAPAPQPKGLHVYYYPIDKKVAVIKALRLIGNMGLKEAKDLSELPFPFEVYPQFGFNEDEARRLLNQAGARLIGDSL